MVSGPVPFRLQSEDRGERVKCYGKLGISNLVVKNVMFEPYFKVFCVNLSIPEVLHSSPLDQSFNLNANRLFCPVGFIYVGV